ncbi:aldo/keto reductase [Microvirga calopogonii]|uniref:aldo/keto reductase n=1 Tax=Microvirga calopogonii TaxID=2078013 RepID=UPI00197C69D1|nr:aldo/keto reductase [Microvirga calopogonii]
MNSAIPPMLYRRLGRTGLEVSAISLGSWATFGECVDDDTTAAVLDLAYARGVNLFDCAETYARGAAEAALGRAFRRLGWPRETFLVSGKVFWGVHGRRPNTWGLSRKHVFEGCDATLRRLGLDYLDLFFCHRYDENVPLVETVRAMSDLVRQGKILHWGTSEWSTFQIREACRIARADGFVPPQVEQVQYNFLTRDKVEGEMRELKADVGIGLAVWSPLAYGLFAGRYDDGEPQNGRLDLRKYAWLREAALGSEEADVLQRVRAVNALAREIGTTPSRMALAWVLRNPDVDTAITGASSPNQLRDTLGALAIVERIDDGLSQRIEVALGRTGGAPERSNAIRELAAPPDVLQQ